MLQAFLERWVTPTPNSRLYNAVIHQDEVAALEALDAPGIRGDIAAENNNYLLRMSAFWGCAGVVGRLLEFDEVAQNAAYLRNEALRIAVSRKQPNVVRVLMENEHVIRDERRGFFCSKLAVRMKQMDVLEIIISVDAIAEDIARNNPLLSWAVHQQNVSLVAFVMSNPRVRAASANDTHFVLVGASKQREPGMIRLLLSFPELARNASVFRNRILLNRIAMDDEPTARLLLRDPSVIRVAKTKYNPALELAAKHNQTHVLETLLSLNEIDPAASKNKALRGAIFHNSLDAATLLLKNKRVVEEFMRDLGPLVFALKLKRVQISGKMLEIKGISLQVCLYLSGNPNVQFVPAIYDAARMLAVSRVLDGHSQQVSPSVLGIVEEYLQTDKPQMPRDLRLPLTNKKSEALAFLTQYGTGRSSSSKLVRSESPIEQERTVTQVCSLSRSYSLQCRVRPRSPSP